MKRVLTIIKELTTIPLVGQTEAGSAEVQPARDSQPKATNCRWGGSYTPAIPFYELLRQFRALLCLKKPPCRRQGSLLTVKWICPIHAEPIHFYKTGYGIILSDDVQESPFYVLGFLNSPLLFQHLLKIGTTLRGGYVRFWTQFITKLPIRRIDFDNPEDRAKHDKMVSLVDRMLDLHKKLAAARVPDEKTRIQRQIDTTDKQIDKLVYELYGLTDEEIKIIEESQHG